MKQKLNTTNRGLKFLRPALFLIVLVAAAASFSPLAKTEVAFADADHDGYSTPADCDDSNPSIHPGALETCNFVDDNCNGEIDEGCRIYYEDKDFDHYGRADRWILTNAPPIFGYS